MTQGINSKSKEEQIEFIKQNIGFIIGYIENPCLEVQLAAVNQDGYCIEHINNPGYEVQLAAIQEKTNELKDHFEFIKPYITYPDLLELLEIKMLACER